MSRAEHVAYTAVSALLWRAWAAAWGSGLSSASLSAAKAAVGGCAIRVRDTWRKRAGTALVRGRIGVVGRSLACYTAFGLTSGPR